MKKISMLLAVLMVVSLVPAGTVWAASPWTTKETTQDKMLGKLQYGGMNLLFGWSEILRHPIEGFRDHGFVEGVKGLGTGLVHGVVDTVGGALHVVTFPLTGIDVPLDHAVGHDS